MKVCLISLKLHRDKVNNNAKIVLVLEERLGFGVAPTPAKKGLLRGSPSAILYSKRSFHPVSNQQTFSWIFYNRLPRDLIGLQDKSLPFSERDSDKHLYHMPLQ